MKAKNPENQQFVDYFRRLVTVFGSDPKGGAFKIKALNKVIPQIISHDFPITSGKHARDCLQGVGKGFADRIDEIIETGTLKELIDDNDDQINAIEQLSRVTGIGDVKAKRLYEEFGISTINELRDAVDSGKLELTHHSIIGLKYLEQFEERIPAKEVETANKLLQKVVHSVDSALILTICGSYRRGRSTCGDIDVLITHPKAKTEGTYLTKLVNMLTESGFLIDHLTATGNKKYMGVCRVIKMARRIDIRFVDYSSYYAAMMYFTGSKHFNIQIRRRALEMGYSLNEYGLHEVKDEEKNIIPVDSEEEIFKVLGIDYVSPKDRDIGEK